MLASQRCGKLCHVCLRECGRQVVETNREASDRDAKLSRAEDRAAQLEAQLASATAASGEHTTALARANGMVEALQHSVQAATKEKDTLIETCSSLKAQLSFSAAEVRP